MKHLFENNRRWAAKMIAKDSQFFTTLSQQQSPEYLWIGCSDSRVPANEIVHLLPGELFVHRNVANLVTHTDFNCLSVMQYAVEVLKVKHIMVVGHYGCGGVQAALTDSTFGLVDNWLQQVKDVIMRNQAMLDPLTGEQKLNRLCELNVIDQVQNVCRTSILQDAWRRGQEISVHGWVYSLQNGHITDLETTISEPSKMQAQLQHSVEFISTHGA